MTDVAVSSSGYVDAEHDAQVAVCPDCDSPRLWGRKDGQPDYSRFVCEDCGADGPLDDVVVRLNKNGLIGGDVARRGRDGGLAAASSAKLPDYTDHVVDALADVVADGTRFVSSSVLADDIHGLSTQQVASALSGLHDLGVVEPWSRTKDTTWKIDPERLERARELGGRADD